VWEALTHFQRHMWCLLTSKNILPPCCWKRRHVFFLVEWSVSTRIVQFVVNWPFSFLFFLLHQELHLGPICYLYFNFSPYFFNFCSWSFYRSFICFQFRPSIPIYQILYFLIWSLFFLFLIFFFDFFVKVLLVFNFIIQSKLMVLCFSIWFLFFLFLVFFVAFL